MHSRVLDSMADGARCIFWSVLPPPPPPSVHEEPLFATATALLWPTTTLLRKGSAGHKYDMKFRRGPVFGNTDPLFNLHPKTGGDKNECYAHI